MYSFITPESSPDISIFLILPSNVVFPCPALNATSVVSASSACGDSDKGSDYLPSINTKPQQAYRG